MKILKTFENYTKEENVPFYFYEIKWLDSRPQELYGKKQRLVAGTIENAFQNNGTSIWFKKDNWKLIDTNDPIIDIKTYNKSK